MTEDLYYQMVSDKTASLFSSSCELGCITVIEDENKRRALSNFGEKFFWIKKLSICIDNFNLRVDYVFTI